jgi:hypothetical protein
MDLFPSQSFELRVSDSPESVRRRVAAHVSPSRYAWWRDQDKEFAGSVSVNGFRLVLRSRGFRRASGVVMVGRFVCESNSTRVHVCARPPRVLHSFWIIGSASVLTGYVWCILNKVGVAKDAWPALFWVFWCVAGLVGFVRARREAVETIVRVLLDSPPKSGLRLPDA